MIFVCAIERRDERTGVAEDHAEAAPPELPSVSE
jgi:hypothetical protein